MFYHFLSVSDCHVIQEAWIMKVKVDVD